MPTGASVSRNGTVRGKKRTGKLSGTGRVSVQVDTWTAKFTEENGVVRRVSTKETNRTVAAQVLAQYEKDVARIKTGVTTRDELEKSHVRLTPLDDLVEQYRTKMTADGCVAVHINNTVQKVKTLFSVCEIDTLAKLRRETIERWIANEISSKKRAAGTINAYIRAIKSFAQYLTEIDILDKHPLRRIRKLNEALDRRKIRRALTKEEVDRLLTTTPSGVKYAAGLPAERVLIYQLLLGTGLRSTELSLLTPSQIDFERGRLRIEAAKTKNKKADVLPLRPDLVQSLQERIAANGIHPQERIFHYNHALLRITFYADLKAAGIKRVGSDGRSLDVHSLCKTFGTHLALAGVPLTIVQRLMRHSTPILTAQLYIDVDPIDMMQALEQLPFNLAPSSVRSQELEKKNTLPANSPVVPLSPKPVL